VQLIAVNSTAFDARLREFLEADATLPAPRGHLAVTGVCQAVADLFVGIHCLNWAVLENPFKRGDNFIIAHIELSPDTPQ
jgi:hypothetical protein